MDNDSKKILFLLYEGIGSTIFNSQVAEHGATLNKLNINIDILAINTWKNQRNESKLNFNKLKKQNTDLNIILLNGVNIFYPIINLYNIYVLSKYLFVHRNNYHLIHARGDYSAYVSLILKPLHKIPVIWDCRGDSIDELSNSLLKKGILYKALGFVFFKNSIRLWLKINTRFADKIIFVSDALKSIYSKNITTSNISIIPCPVTETKFYFSRHLRATTRKYLGIYKYETVYIYSGSMISYQYIDGLVLLCSSLLQVEHNIVIILTTDDQLAKIIFSHFSANNKLIIMRSDFNQTVNYYNAADFGILLREKRRLNYVASPTKFGEYCLSGLPVIMNDTVNQAKNIANKLGNYISAKDIQTNKFTNSKRVEIAQDSKSFFARSVLNDYYVKLYNNS